MVERQSERKDRQDAGGRMASGPSKRRPEDHPRMDGKGLGIFGARKPVLARVRTEALPTFTREILASGMSGMIVSHPEQGERTLSFFVSLGVVFDTESRCFHGGQR